MNYLKEVAKFTVRKAGNEWFQKNAERLNNEKLEEKDIKSEDQVRKKANPKKKHKRIISKEARKRNRR